MRQHYAVVNCPACGTKFQTPVEQILDVRVDPSVKNRILSGGVNVAVCPVCGTGGNLNLPFIYHDPEKETALLYLPVETGRTEVERQKFAGTLTQKLMDSLPVEERKGYLLQPETFINLDTLIRHVLELEGVTEEEMERRAEQQELVQNLLSAPQEEWEAMIAENDALIDETFFAFLEYISQLIARGGAEQEGSKVVEELRSHLIENHPLGKSLGQRSEVLRIFVENPGRESLLEALEKAQDEETQRFLIENGLPFIDYAFFQALLKRIEGVSDPAEQERLKALRRYILDMRKEIMDASEDMARAKATLLGNLLSTEDPLKMARSHRSELDDLFHLVLRSEMERAQAEEDQEYFDALVEITQVLERMMEENLPPTVALIRRLLMTPSEKEMDALLSNNQALLQPRFFEVLDSLQATSRERGDTEVVERLESIRAKARLHAPAEPAVESKPQPQAAPDASKPLGPGEETTASGLIIAKR